MKTIMNKLAANKALSAALIVTLTILYLLGTAAFAQSDTLSKTDNYFKLDYTRDPLSFGDLWKFDETLYGQSAYAGPAVNLSSTSFQFYDEVLSSTPTDFSFADGYFSSLDFEDHTAPTGTKIAVMSFDKFHGNYTTGSVKGLNGANITTMLPDEGMIARYTAIPSSLGTYRVYVYSQDDPTGSVGFRVLDSAADNNAFAADNKVEYPKFFQAASGWWYATIQVEATGWTGAYPGNSTGTESLNEGTTKPDTLPSSDFATSKLTDTLLGTSKKTNYYNVWTYTEVRFNTLITIEWSGEIQLGTIVKETTIAVNNQVSGEGYKGSAKLTNIFGEMFTVAAGEEGTWTTARVPFTLLTTPDNEKVSVLDAISGLDHCVQNEGWYSFEDIASLSIALKWARFIPLPEISVVSGQQSYGTANFYAGNNLGVSTDMGAPGTYTITLDFANSDSKLVKYTIGDKTGELTPDHNTISVPVEADNVTLTLETLDMELNRTCTVSFLPGVPGLPHNVKNLKTGVTYQFIEDALAAANSGDTIMLLGNVSFRETGRKTSWGSPTDGGPGYTVKSNVTLLLPYSQDVTTIRDENDKFIYANCDLVNATIADLDPMSNVTLTLTVPVGISIYNNGLVTIGGVVDGGSNQGYGGVTSGAHANMELNGTLNMGSTGVLSVTGYILGSGTINANAANGGAKIYQLFSVLDFRGGTYALAASGKTDLTSPVKTQSGESLITAFNRFAFLGIQTKMVITKGNEMYGYCDLYADGDHNRACVKFIGTKATDALLALTADNTVLTISYDADTHLESMYYSGTLLPYDKIGKTTLSVSGNAELGYMTLAVELKGIVTVNMGTNEATFNVPYNFAVELTDGTFKIGNDMSLLPGASLTVGENATVQVTKRLHVYAGLVDARVVNNSKSITSSHASAHITNYPSTAQLQCDSFGGNGMANLIVDGGTLDLQSGARFSGLVQTTGSGSLVVNSNASVSGSNTHHQFAATGEVYTNLVIREIKANVAGACVFTDGGRIVDPATGAITPLTAGIYTAHPYSSSLGSYSYTMYTNSADTSEKTVYTEALGAAVQGAWFVESTTAGKLDSADGAVAKVTNSAGKLEYYSSLQAAVSAAADGDTVTLLKSVTLNQPIASNADITLDLNSMVVTCSNGLLVNSGTMTLVLGDSNINRTGTNRVPCITNLSDGNLTIDTGTAVITWEGEYEASMLDVRATVIANHGTMTIGGNGTIRMDAHSITDVAHNGYNIQHASVIHNEGTLTVGTVNLYMTQQTNSFAAVIVNHKGTLDMVGTKITNVMGHGLYNLGGTVNSIVGGTMEGEYGIINQNIAGGKASVDNGLFVTMQGTITEILGVEIKATVKWALENHAYIGTIGGNTILTSPTQTVMNSAKWYFNTATYKTETIDGVKHTFYGLETLPTIELITGKTSIHATGSKTYAVHNEGLIKEISATQKAETNEQATIYSPNGYGLYVYRTGRVDKISGNTTIYAMQYALRITEGFYNDTYTEKVENGNVTTSTTYYLNYTPASVQEITGNATIKAIGLTVLNDDGTETRTAGTYGLVLENGGHVGIISGNVTISADSNTLVLSGQVTVKKTTITSTNADSSYDTTTITEYIISTLDEIRGANGEGDQGVLIEGLLNSGTCISNTGRIGSIHGKVTITAANPTAITNSEAAGLRKVVEKKFYDAEKKLLPMDKAIHERTDYYHEDGAYIGQIGGEEGDVITITALKYGISNAGHMGLIGEGVNISVATAKGGAIYNSTGRREQLHYEYYMEYLPIEEEKNVQTKVLRTYTYTSPTIDKIQGATLSNTLAYGIHNKGYIGQILNCTVSANTYSIYNDPAGYYTFRETTMVCVYTTLTHSTSYDTVAEYATYYEANNSEIGLIDGCTIKSVVESVSAETGEVTVADAASAIVNSGVIGTIRNNTITGSTTVVYNTGKPVAKYQLLNADTYLIKDETTGKYSKGTAEARTSHSGLPVIHLIAEGNVITASASSGIVVVNMGLIEKIDAGSGEASQIYGARHGIRNYQGQAIVDDDGNTIYMSARIGVIKKVIIRAARNAILNGDGNANYTDVLIEELGEGLVAIGTGSSSYVTVNINATNASIGKISGGDYYHKSGAKYTFTDYLNQNYVPDPCATLSTDPRVVQFDGTNYKCYFVVVEHTLGEDCVCDNCGLFEFYASNVRLGNSLEMMFAFPAAGLQGDLEGYYVKAERSYADGSYEVVTYYYGQPYVTVVFTDANGESTTLQLKQSAWRTTNIGGVNYHVVTYSRFAAKEMCDSISLTVCKMIGGEEKVFSTVWTDSIKDYTMRLLDEHMGQKPILCTLLVDMLNYGAACQEHFGYDPGNLANAELTAEQLACGTGGTPENSDDFAADRGQNGNGYWSSSTVIADCDSQFAVAFNKMTEGMYFTYSLTNHHGNTIEKTITYGEMTSPGIYHELANLRLADVREEITIIVYDANRKPVGTWKDSIEAYCYRMIEKAGSDVESSVYKNLLKFADSAKVYLHSEEVLQ